ncbi:ABC transporter permease [Desemzia sp. RIT804]|uniref:oligopeptide ABC transporter permease n=1 Tax=Desemzia sp. RIT 804 TaxID=2810209 RepID=UPI00195025B4|nr:oligopeptide ABC transporter permease [Desemzia sp. RIT 804]MBM6613674.1 ABC transporter permease [Desemzia sp. RIT 804]
MWKTILRRVVVMIPQVFILSIIVFALAQAMPGDPFTGLITPQTDPAVIENLREQAGLNDPIPVQYVRWLGNAVQGDFGQSYTYKIPVASIIGQRAGNTILLSLLSFILTYLIAIPLGMLAGRYNNSWLDKIVVIYNYVSYAIPTFVLALLMLWLFGYTLNWFPTSGSVDVTLAKGSMDYYLNKGFHLILPAITYALLGTTTIIQYLRSEVVDAKTQDYVKTARSKGVPEKVVYSRHIFRNSALPIASTMGYQITGLIGGSIFIEKIFAFPGMGQLFISSLTSRDYSVIVALTLLFGVATLVGTLLSDIIMTIVDPRIRID